MGRATAGVGCGTGGGGGVGRAATWHIQAGGIHRAPAYTRPHAHRIHCIIALRHLALVKGADAGGGQIERGTQFRRQPGQRRIQIGSRNFPALAIEIDTIKLRREFGHGRIAVGFHIGDDGRNGGGHIGGIVALGINQRGKGGGKARIACVKPLRHQHFP